MTSSCNCHLPCPSLPSCSIDNYIRSNHKYIEKSLIDITRACVSVAAGAIAMIQSSLQGQVSRENSGNKRRAIDLFLTVEVTSLNVQSFSQRRVRVPASARLSCSSSGCVRKQRGCASSLSSSSPSSVYIRDLFDWNTKPNVRDCYRQYEKRILIKYR